MSTKNWIVAGMLIASATQAETFHSKDGILFEGTIRLAASNAASCNVLEASEPEYEQLKVNQGRPLHLWRVDISVRNVTSRELDYLRADSWVLSKWPPCTNWDGLAALPEPFIGMAWVDHLEVLGMPNGMRLDQTESRALYMLAFDGQRPRFGEWDINYRFAGGEPEPARGASDLRPASPASGNSGPGPEPTCADQAEGAACWKELTSHAGCHVWDDYYYADQTVTWTGECSDGLAGGTGMLKWVRGSDETESAGLIRNGERNGHWVLRFASGNVEEGPYVDGKQNGHWVLRLADGGVQEGPVMDGKRTGRWVER